MTVIIRQFASALKVTLDAEQRYLFSQELRRVKRYYPYAKGPPPGMNPDCTITVTEKGKQAHYALFGHAILYEEKTKRRRQFYFGFLLLQWLVP